MTAWGTMEHEVDQLIVNTIKTLSMDAVQAANWGTPARRWAWRMSPRSFEQAPGRRPDGT